MQSFDIVNMLVLNNHIHNIWKSMNVLKLFFLLPSTLVPIG
jgi:hypothetical protein